MSASTVVAVSYCNVTLTFGVFVFNTNLAFLYKIDHSGVLKKIQQKIELLPVGTELTTPTMTGLEF